MRALTYLSVLLLLGGCAWFSWLPWVDAPKDKDDTKPAKLVDFDPEVRFKRQWGRKVGQGLGRKFLTLDPLILADRIFAADGYGRVVALDRYSGERVWQVDVDPLKKGFGSRLDFLDRRDPSFVSGGIGSGDGNVFIGTTSGYVVALSAADGSETWRTYLDAEVLAKPSSGDGLIFAQTVDGRLVALEEDTGEVRWTQPNQVPVLTLRGTSSPVFDSGVVYSGFASGKIVAVRARNGEPIWEHRVQLPEGRSELERIVDVDGTPLINQGVLYAAAYQGRVKALRLRDGRPLWEKVISSYHDMALGQGNVYVVDNDDVVRAIDRQSSDVVWEQPALTRRKLSAPLAYSNYVIVGDDQGYVHVLAQSDGRMLARKKIDGKGVRSNMVARDRTLYVLGNSGSLEAYEIQTLN